MAEEQQSVGPTSVGHEDLGSSSGGREDVGPASGGREDVGPSSVAPEASIEPAYSVQLQVGFVGNIRLTKLLSNHSGEADVWVGERPNGDRVAVDTKQPTVSNELFHNRPSVPTSPISGVQVDAACPYVQRAQYLR